MSTVNWQELQDKRPLDPKTPAEYVEAMRRMLGVLVNGWDGFEDGDGETSSPEDGPQTKTDMFQLIAGTASCACECIRDFRVFQP